MMSLNSRNRGQEFSEIRQGEDMYAKGVKNVFEGICFNLRQSTLVQSVPKVKHKLPFVAPLLAAPIFLIDSGQSNIQLTSRSTRN